MAVTSPSDRTLEYTPSWALATVSSIFILISLVVERSLHRLGHYLHRTKRKSFLLALQKLKDELMLTGFISLTITVFTTPISKICVKSSDFNTWTPCDLNSMPAEAPYSSNYSDSAGGRRRLLAAKASYCDEGYEPFVSYNTLHQLHIFIFVLVGIHVTYSCLTMVLALTKVYTWKKWEKEAHDAVAQHNSSEFFSSVNLYRQSTFVRYHASKPLGLKFLVWVVAFFRQFLVPRVDYLTLRLSFVTTHNLQQDYDFHAYIIRCMEDEFETIVGISLYQWAFVVGYLLFSLAEPWVQFYVAWVPLAVVLVIGMKLQHVIATLALEHSGVKGPFVGVLLTPRDQLFWFNGPKFLLHVIHFIFFESAFELAMFIWHVWQFDFKTCLLEDNKTHLYLRLAIGVATQLFCCYSTFPLYTLVSQMSTTPKAAFLPKNVERGLRRWHLDAQSRVKLRVLESYQADRLAKRRVTPLDERYFVNSDSLAEAASNYITESRHAGRTSTPMTLIMEEGGSLHNAQTSCRDDIFLVVGADQGDAPHHQAQSRQPAASMYRESPPKQQNQGAGKLGAVEMVPSRATESSNIRRRVSPTSPMDLRIQPFQVPEGASSTPRPPPGVHRSATMK